MQSCGAPKIAEVMREIWAKRFQLRKDLAKIEGGEG